MLHREVSSAYQRARRLCRPGSRHVVGVPVGWSSSGHLFGVTVFGLLRLGAERGIVRVPKRWLLLPYTCIYKDFGGSIYTSEHDEGFRKDKRIVTSVDTDWYMMCFM